MNAFDYFFEKSRSLDKMFVLGPKEQASYAEVYSRSLSLATYMQQHFGSEKSIVVIIPNSVYFITVYLACLKSGNVCVPLNPATEPGNLDYILQQSGAKVGFIAKNLRRNFESSNGITFYDEDDFEKFCAVPANGNLPATIPDGQLAELIFTSGSTGLPKGVMLTHKNLIANTASIVEYLKLTEQDTIEIVLPFFYCYGLSLLHTHLRVGGSVVLNNSFIFIGSVINDLKNYKCTGFAGVPSHYQILLRKTKSFKTTEFPDLRYVTQAGGKLHTVFISEFIEAFPKVDFYVMYGQTEATARLSHLPPARLADKLGSIGRGIPGVELRVVDEAGNDITPGETGEIIAKGDNIMPGYLNDTEATNHALRNGWLYTGDLATVDTDGFIYLTARKKEIIKVGGKRVSPKEIEEVIVTIPEVVDCTIEAIDDDLLGEAIKATLVVASLKENILTAENVQRYCAGKLASFKVPQVIEFIDKVEVNSAGKKVKKV